MNKNEIKKILKKYNIIPLLIFGAVLIVLCIILINIIPMILQLTPNNQLYRLIKASLPLALFLLWIYVSYITIRDSIYKSKTGRSLGADQGKYNKSFPTLLRYYTSNDDTKMDINQLPILDWKDADGMIFGRIKDNSGNYRLIYNPPEIAKNAIGFGLPGTGKTTSIAACSAISWNRNTGGGGVFAISIKGDLLNFIRQGGRKNIKVFSPNDKAISCTYDPLREFRHMDDLHAEIFAKQMAIQLYQMEKSDSSEYFVEGSRDCYTGITLYLKHYYETNNKELYFYNIPDFITKNGYESVFNAINESDCMLAKKYIRAYIDENPRNVGGIYGHLSRVMRQFLIGNLPDILKPSNNEIVPEDLESHDVIIDLPQDLISVYAGVTSLIVSQFMNYFMQKDDISRTGVRVRSCLFILDEFIQLGLDYNETISPALSTLRSKGISILILCQSLNQLSGLYGENKMRSIMDLCSYINIYSVQDPQSKRYFQDLIGKHKELKNSTSSNTQFRSSIRNTSHGTTVSEQEEYSIDLATLNNINTYDKNGNEIKRVIVYANGKYAIAEQTLCYE